jgi:hypothetical protein
MKSHAELIQDFNAAGVGFLMTELDVAYSFTNVAKGPYSVDRRERLIRIAKRALGQALSMRSRLRLSAAEEERFQRLRAAVEKALAALATEPVPGAHEAKAA